MAESRAFLAFFCLVTLGACAADDEGDADDGTGGADAAPAADAPAPLADAADPGADAAPPEADAAPAMPDAAPRVSAAILDGLGPAPLATEAEALLWARTASAPQIAFNAYLPITQADALLGGGQLCPKLAVDGDVRTYTGGCTTTGGETWSGVARVTGPLVDGVPARVEYVGFGHNAVVACGGPSFTTVALYTGTIDRGGAIAPLPVAIDLRVAVSRPNAACAVETFELAYDYALTLSSAADGNMNGQPDSRTWDGGGRVGKSGGEAAGLVQATTALEVTGEACASEALSGSTTLVAGGHTLVLTYDGATDCDNPGTVQRSYDGNALGELAGVGCRAVRGGVGFLPVALVLLGLALVSAGRGRRTARRADGRRGSRPRGRRP